MDGPEIVRHYTILQQERRAVEGVWELISKFIVPFRGEFYRDLKSENEVNWRSRHRFDDTAVDACDTLAASIQGSLTSPMVKWFDMRFRTDDLNSNAEAMGWLSDAAERVHLALQESNFNLQMSEAYLDICSFGTGALVEEVAEENQEFKNLLFKAIPIRECFFEEDAEGNVVNFYRKLEMSPLAMTLKFGKDNVPKYVSEEAFEARGVDKKYTVIFCIYLNRDNMKADTSKTLPPKSRPYGYKYVLVNDKSIAGEEGGYYEMPVFITKWGKASGTKWGYSPAHKCLGDILTLNQMVDMILVSAEKVLDPPSLAQERTIIGDLDLGASGVTTVRNIDGLKPYESRARFDVSSLERRELQASIRRAFKVDQLELKESPAMTATEVQVRYELMQRLLGPTLGRLQSDLLDPIIIRTFFILFRAGELPEMPQIVLENQGELDIEYLGPMAKAQKMDKVVSVQRWFQLAAPIAEFKPEIFDLVDVDKIGREAAILLDVPLKDDGLVRKERKDRADAQARAQQMAETQESGKAMQEMGKGFEVMPGGKGGGQSEQGTEGAGQGLP